MKVIFLAIFLSIGVIFGQIIYSTATNQVFDDSARNAFFMISGIVVFAVAMLWEGSS